MLLWCRQRTVKVASYCCLFLEHRQTSSSALEGCPSASSRSWTRCSLFFSPYRCLSHWSVCLYTLNDSINDEGAHLPRHLLNENCRLLKDCSFSLEPFERELLFAGDAQLKERSKEHANVSKSVFARASGCELWPTTDKKLPTTV